MAAFNPQTAPLSSFGPPAPASAHGAPVGTFAPGTKVQVGGHRVVIERYLSEGGFAHVYVVRLPKPVDGSDLAVLKRVAVPDKEHLANMRNEVETMKKLKGHRHIVRYMDSQASQLKGGGYEVFLLMEYCSGGGLIDFMNTRLWNRLTEPEILKIFSDVAEGVACMHYLRPPLLHRDLKVENVLISDSGSSRTYKLCDFGSAAAPRPAASNATEGQSINDNIRRHTTLQYRSPEMIDVYRKQPIDEKSDIWALGVFLYKLCYYTTPFEEGGQMAILNASFKFPADPLFSDQLKLLIAKMLKENPADRLDIYQVLQVACSMQGKEVPIHDIYDKSGSQSERRRSQQLHLPPEATSAATGAMWSPPPQKKAASQAIPDIAPMRRGRPTKAVSHHGSAQPSPSPLRMVEQRDPFASLDGNNLAANDELSSRFPSLDQFSLLTEKGKTHDFEPSPHGKVELEKADLPTRVLGAVADKAFARPSSPEKPKPTKTAPLVINPSSRVVLDRRKSYEVKDMPRQHDDLVSPVPERPLMVSTGTMTSPSPPPASDVQTIHQHPSANRRRRPSSLPRSPEASRPRSAVVSSGSRLADLLNQDAARSQPAALAVPKSPSSSRPSLEGRRPSMMEFDSGVSRSKSTNSKMRPVSGSVVSKMEFYRGRSSSKTSLGEDESPRKEDHSPPAAVESDTTITSDVEFLRAKEGEKVWKGYKRHSSGSGHRKRASLASISLSGTKSLLTGRFGEAFRKFEGGSNGFSRRSRSPSPSQEHLNVMTPIAGSEATDLSDERPGLDGMEGLSPETRRELERRRLSAEEKRVANAGAEYKKRLAENGEEKGRDPTRAVSIQNKVQSLLQENDRPTTKTAAGYGRYTNSDANSQMKQFEAPSSTSTKQPSGLPAANRVAARATVSVQPLVSEPASAVSPLLNAPLHGHPPRTVKRPAASPKPTKIRIDRDETTLQPVQTDIANGDIAISPSDEWEANFSKRYPSLSGIEMVETEIDGPKVAAVRTKEI